MADNLPREIVLPAELLKLGRAATIERIAATALVTAVGWRALCLRSLRTLREAEAGAREPIDPVRDC